MNNIIFQDIKQATYSILHKKKYMVIDFPSNRYLLYLRRNPIEWGIYLCPITCKS